MRELIFTWNYLRKLTKFAKFENSHSRKLIPAKYRKLIKKEYKWQINNLSKLICAKCPISLVRMAVFPVSFYDFRQSDWLIWQQFAKLVNQYAGNRKKWVYEEPCKWCYQRNCYLRNSRGRANFLSLNNSRNIVKTL